MFAVGDVVRLKSGSLRMTVAEIESNGNGALQDAIDILTGDVGFV